MSAPTAIPIVHRAVVSLAEYASERTTLAFNEASSRSRRSRWQLHQTHGPPGHPHDRHSKSREMREDNDPLACHR